MENYTYQNNLISKKQLRQLLAWSFTKYDSMQACSLADELKYVGFHYASKAGISISIEDLKIPFVKNRILKKANQELYIAEKIYLKGKLTEVERFQKIIDTWNLTSESLKNQIIYYFKNYDPLNSVYIMAFSGARGNLSQVRQLVGMRGLMADPSGQIMNLPIKKNFREGLTITDYLISGYGARKGIVDTALKTANSGYLTRRLIDVAQDILIREKDCFTNNAFIFHLDKQNNKERELNSEKIVGRVLNKSIVDPITNTLLASKNTQITFTLLQQCKDRKIKKVYVRSPLTCRLYRAICQKCYGWDLANENLIDIGEAIGILAGQSIGEPGTQLTMRTFHTGGIFTSEIREQIISPLTGIIKFNKALQTVVLRTNRGEDVLVTKNSGSLILVPNNKIQDLLQINVSRNTILFPKNNQYIIKNTVIGELINTKKQIKTELKPILSSISGEIFIPRLKQNINLLNNNKLIWILFGEFYNSPIHSFLNFYSDYKLNSYNSIFRTKLISHYSGFVKLINDKKNLYQRLVKIANKKCSGIKFKLQKLEKSLNLNNYLLSFNNSKYLIKIRKNLINNYLNYFQTIENKEFGLLISNSFLTLTGGTSYYALQNSIRNNVEIYYFFKTWKSKNNIPNFQGFKTPRNSKKLRIKRALKKQKKYVSSFQKLRKSKKHMRLLLNQKKSRKHIQFLEKSIRSREYIPFLRKLTKEIPLFLGNFKKRIPLLKKWIKFLIKINIYLCDSNHLRFRINFKKYYNRAVQIFRAVKYYPCCFCPRTIIWLGEETHTVKCQQKVLLVENGDFISTGFELIPGLFSNTSGFVILTLNQKNINIVETISIKSGVVYEGDKFEDKAKKLYYPGELILSDLVVENLSFCEYITGKNLEQLLVRPVEIYENSWSETYSTNLQIDRFDSLYPTLQLKNIFPYKSNQTINSIKNVKLVSNVLMLRTNNFLNSTIDTSIELFNTQNENSLLFNIIEKLRLTQYINPSLKYKNLQSCFLVQKNQFISNYTILGYLESLTLNPLEIVKIKTKKQSTKKILLISNNHCLTLKKSEIKNEKINTIVTSEINLTKIGKIIIENDNLITIQKGKSYFFPNCKKESQTLQSSLKYKIFPPNRIYKIRRKVMNKNTGKKKVILDSRLNRPISLTYSNFIQCKAEKICKSKEYIKTLIRGTFWKFFLKNNGKLYSCLIPRLVRKFAITNQEIGLETQNVLDPYRNSPKILNSTQYASDKWDKFDSQILFLQTSKRIKNKLKSSSNYQLIIVKFLNQKFSQHSNRSVGLYSITEDYFEKEVNSVFCTNHDFIEAGTTIGLLHLEKEITGDIVQGLPRIEEILEARKKNLRLKRIPTSQKPSLLIQKTALDSTYEFRKLGTLIRETDKVNPHKLLKVYFNYYGLVKHFLCYREKIFKRNRLTKNYEASYKSFQQVQLFILNLVQSVYYSQGVKINNKHLEVIIKQMTTKVLITSEGNTPLLRREIIDLYHINYMNIILKREKKPIAYYVPLLVGITKAALNNPSFISAASFQETTKVLTKAAIEGRIDWLRGLKENIIIGHLIPAGTGSPNYQNSFKKAHFKNENRPKSFTNLENDEYNSRQKN